MERFCFKGSDHHVSLPLFKKSNGHHTHALINCDDMIHRADYVLNLHQAYDFYAHKWISRQRNPSKWGQCNVIDAPIYPLRNGEKSEPGNFAQRVAERSNSRIRNVDYHFLVKNTNTAFGGSRHKEQRGSLTYYAMARLHKIALGVEATRNCFLPEAIAFLTIAVNAALEEAGIRTETTPSEDYLIIGRELKEKKGKSRSGKNRRTDEMAKT